MSKNEENTLNYASTQDLKVALVTGSARRIGAAIAKCLHQAGYSIAIHYDQSHQEAADLCTELNVQRANSARLFQKNFSIPPVGFIQEVFTWHSRLDLLVNNASIFIKSKHDYDSSLWQKLFTVNTEAPFVLSTEAFPILKKTQGQIINITDIHATIPLKDYSIYCQSKAALWMQTKILAKEFAPDVRVNAIAPGAIAWPEADNELAPALKEKILQQTPLKKHGHPGDIAQMVLAIASQPFITGQIIAIDGGRSLNS